MRKFEFSPYINSLPKSDEMCYLVNWHPDGGSPFKAWIRGDIVYMLETDWNDHPKYSPNRLKSYVAHICIDGQWYYYSRHPDGFYIPELETMDNPIMLNDLNKILAEHNFQSAIESAINSDRK